MEMRAKCVKTHIVETEATCIETGEKFKKRFKIEAGTTGIGIVEGINGRIMIRLDNPLTATNEKKAPYKSQMYRTFIPIDSVKGRWQFSN